MDMGLITNPYAKADQSTQVYPGNIQILPDDINHLPETAKPFPEQLRPKRGDTEQWLENGVRCVPLYGCVQQTSDTTLWKEAEKDKYGREFRNAADVADTKASLANDKKHGKYVLEAMNLDGSLIYINTMHPATFTDDINEAYDFLSTSLAQKALDSLTDDRTWTIAFYGEDVLAERAKDK
jgi:hypothetical protein